MSSATEPAVAAARGEALRERSYAEALFDATVQEMERDPSVFVFGLGVDDPRGIHGTTLGLAERFGPERCFDTPLAEDSMTGVAVGAALAGLRPVHVHERVDFLLLCMNQLVNVAAKARYTWAGATRVPLTVRAAVGRSWGQGPQHSQALHAFFTHVPGLKVAVPATPHDAKGCLAAAIRDDDPVIVMESRMLYRVRGVVPDAPYVVPFGRARTLSFGADVTVVALSHMVLEALRARERLAAVGVSAEVIDPVTLTPLDVETLAGSVARTRRLLVVDNGWTACGLGAEIVVRVIEALQGECAPRVARMGFAPTPCPTTRTLEDVFYPDAARIAARAFELVTGEAREFPASVAEADEVAAFRGPF
jgi:pyruvate/2-oxoglutarate/acetoin dehydrogenase E1 component